MLSTTPISVRWANRTERHQGPAMVLLWGRVCQTLGTLCGHADPDLDDPRQDEGLDMAAALRRALEES